MPVFKDLRRIGHTIEGLYSVKETERWWDFSKLPKEQGMNIKTTENK